MQTIGRPFSCKLVPQPHSQRASLHPDATEIGRVLASQEAIASGQVGTFLSAIIRPVLSTDTNRSRFLRDIERGIIGHGASPSIAEQRLILDMISLGNRRLQRQGDTPRLR